MNLKLLPSRVALPPVKAKSGQRIIRATPPNAASTLSKTKVPSFVQLLRPRRSTVLSTIKISATVVGKVGSATPVPLIQPIADGVNKIVEYCEVRAQTPQSRSFPMSLCVRADRSSAQEGMRRAQGPRAHARRHAREGDGGCQRRQARSSHGLCPCRARRVRSAWEYSTS